MTIRQRVSPHSRTGWAGKGLRSAGFILSFVLGLTLLWGSPVQAATQYMTYEVYGGGINAVSAEMVIAAEAPDRYRIDFAAYTKGLLGRLAPWRGSFASEGVQDKSGIGTPLLHRSTAIWRGEEDIKEYRYDGKGKFLSYKEIENNRVEEKMPDAALVQGTMDVMTATLNALHRVGDGKDCAGRAEIFDGSRRFTLSFRYEGEEDLKATRYNIFEGKAQRCIAEIEKGPGKWHKKPRGWISIQEQGRRAGGLPTVWFATLTPGEPAIPVRIQVKSDYGAMLMHLVGYKNIEE